MSVHLPHLPHHPVRQLVGHLTGHGLYPLIDKHGHQIGWECHCHGWRTGTTDHTQANDAYVRDHLAGMRS